MKDNTAAFAAMLQEQVKLKPILTKSRSPQSSGLKTKRHEKKCSFDERESPVLVLIDPPRVDQEEVSKKKPRKMEQDEIEVGFSAAEYVPRIRQAMTTPLFGSAVSIESPASVSPQYLSPLVARRAQKLSPATQPRNGDSSSQSLGSGSDSQDTVTSDEEKKLQHNPIQVKVTNKNEKTDTSRKSLTEGHGTVKNENRTLDVKAANGRPQTRNDTHTEAKVKQGVVDKIERGSRTSKKPAENKKVDTLQIDNLGLIRSISQQLFSRDSLSPSPGYDQDDNASHGSSADSHQQTGNSTDSAFSELESSTPSDQFRTQLSGNHERLHQELRVEHLKVEHTLETAQRAVLFTAREAFLNQTSAFEIQASKEAQSRELAWLAEKQKQQLEERTARATIKAMQAEQVKLIKSLQNRIKDLEEVVNIAKTSHLQNSRKREQFSKKLAFIEEQQQKERQLLLDSQLRSSEIDRKLYEIEIRHLPDWKRRVLLEERKLVEQKKNIYLHRQAEHLREFQLLQLRHMQKVFDAELNDHDRKDEVLSDQRAELQSLRARHFKEFRAEKERLAAQRSLAKSKAQQERMELQIQMFRTQQARFIRHTEANNRRQGRMRQKQFEEDEKFRDAEFRESINPSKSSRLNRQNSRDSFRDSSDARSEDLSVASSSLSDVLHMDLDEDNEAANNAHLNSGGAHNDDKFGISSQTTAQDLQDLVKKSKQSLEQITIRHQKEIEDLLNLHREQLDMINEENKKRMSALKNLHEDEIKSMKMEQLEDLKELERLQKEEQLSAKMASDQTDAVLTGMMDAMVVADQSGIIQIFNAASQNLFGYSEDEMIGHNVRELMDISEGCRHQGYIERYLRTGETKLINTPGREVLGRHKSGELIPIWLSVSDRDLQGKRIFVACIHDIRSQKEKEKEILATTEKVKSIIESMMEPLIVSDQTGTITEFNSATCQLFGYTREELLGKNVRSLTGPEVSRRHDSFIERYLRTRQGVVIGTSGREVIGFGKDGNTIPIRLSLSASETSDGKTMFVAILSDIRAMKAKEEAIKAQSESFQIILDSLDEPVLVCQTNGTIKQTNAATERLLGYSTKDLLGHNLSLLEGPEAPKWNEKDFLELLDRIAEKGTKGVLVRRRAKHGKELNLSISASQRHISGEKVFIVTYSDLSEIAAREQEISAKSEQLSAVLDSMLEPLIVSDQSGNMLTVNSAAINMFGYSREELLKNNVAILTGPSLEKIHHTFIDSYLKTGIGRVVGTTGRNVTGYRKDGSEIPLRLSLSDRVVNGRRVFVAVLVDISFQISKEKAIAEQAENVRSVLDSMLEPVICTSSNGTVTMINKAVSMQLQYTEKDLLGQNVSILTGPEISQVHDSFIERYLSTGKGKVIGTAGREIVAFRKDGSTVKARLSLSDRLIDGQRAFIGVLSPLSTAALSSQFESEMLSNVLDLLPDCVAITNADGNMVKVNDSLCELFGYASGDLVGQHASILIHGSVGKGEFMRKYLNSGPDPRDATARHRDGSSMKVIMAATHKKSAQGTGYIVFINSPSE